MGTHPIFESDFDCLTEYVFTPACNHKVAPVRIVELTCSKKLN